MINRKQSHSRSSLHTISEMRGVKGTTVYLTDLEGGVQGALYLLEEVRPLLLDCPPRDQKKPGVRNETR